MRPYDDTGDISDVSFLRNHMVTVCFALHSPSRISMKEYMYDKASLTHNNLMMPKTWWSGSFSQIINLSECHWTHVFYYSIFIQYLAIHFNSNVGWYIYVLLRIIQNSKDLTAHFHTIIFRKILPIGYLTQWTQIMHSKLIVISHIYMEGSCTEEIFAVYHKPVFLCFHILK